MTLQNKLGITNPADLARDEERISKKKAAELFEQGILETFRSEPLKDWRIFIVIYLMTFMISPARLER